MFPKRSSRPDFINLGEERKVILGELLGKGASATVYSGILESESGLQRPVAVKLFPNFSSEDDLPFAKAIALSAQRVACIAHPNVAAVYEIGIVRGATFLVSELVEGVSLSMLLAHYAERRARVPLDVSLFIATEIAHGLDGARVARGFDGMRLGLLHLGLAPTEILFSWRGEVKVTDFELSLARAATSSVRNLQELRGRVAYMAPEVASGQKGDARSDVFSLGVVLRELFVGSRFPRSVSSADAVRLAREGYVHPICFQPDLPPALVAIMQRALDVDPEVRFPHAGAMAFELRRVAMGMGVGDGRYFLRRVLQHELREETSEVTSEFASWPPADPEA